MNVKCNQVKTKDWQGQLNLISNKLDNRFIDIEMIGTNFTDHFEARSIHLKELNYDPKYNVVHIETDDFEHSVQSPTAIYFTSVDDNMSSIESIEIIDDKDRQQIVTFEKPVLLGL
jgi:hypothetical protein